MDNGLLILKDAAGAEIGRSEFISDAGSRYYPTAKNGMVREFYQKQGFKKTREDETGNTMWAFDLRKPYQRKQQVIRVNEAELKPE